MAYKSKYYDPVKAHEYYVKHRKLKGRKKGKGRKKSASKTNRLSLTNLNESGLSAANKAKASINIEKKEFNKKLSEALKNKVKELKEKMKDATEVEREAAVLALKDKFAEIKKQTNAYYKEKYAREIDTIKADKSNNK